MRFAFILYSASASFQAVVLKNRQAGPSVTILNGTVIGSTSNNVDSFKGIPYSQSPVGDRRLRPPISLASSFGTITATKDGPPCPPNSQSSTPALGPEDCLYLNVQRPADTQAGRNLPVVACIYGGGFGAGSTIGYDGTQIINEATSGVGEPLIFVVFNYRLAGWGFLASAELSNEGSTNLGLRDQRLALQWIQDNIRAFGGDPAKVTIWGESAGSFSVLDHLIINNGNNQYKSGQLFRAAIMSSGTSLATFPVRHPRPRATFDKLVSLAGCTNAVNKLTCLRALSPDAYAYGQAIVGDPGDRTLVPYAPRPDPASSFFPTSPEKALLAGTFQKGPRDYWDSRRRGNHFPELSRADATAFVNTYPGTPPDSVTAGSPFRTGLDNEVYTGYKRVSALFGDYVFSLSARISLDSIASLVPAYSSIGTYLYGQSNRGTQHGIDTSLVLFGSPSVPVYFQKKFRYVSFFSYADPNYLGINGNAQIRGDPNYGQWPRYTTASRLLVNFTHTPSGASLIADTFRQSSYQEMKRNISRFTS